MLDVSPHLLDAGAELSSTKSALIVPTEGTVNVALSDGVPSHSKCVVAVDHFPPVASPNTF